MQRLLLLFVVGCASRYVLGKCDAQGACRSGASCRFDECVADATQPAGEICSDSRQCVSGLFCPKGIPLCSRPCTKYYAHDSECGESGACVPVADPDHPGLVAGGACVPSECKIDEDCLANDGLFASASPQNGCISGICLLRCQPGARLADKPAGVDRCVSDRRGNPTHCSLVTVSDHICTPVGTGANGGACSLFPALGDPPACGLYDGEAPLMCTNGTCQHVP